MSDERPWFRVYRKASAAFQLLEPHHRGVLLEIMRYTDARGRIALSGRTPEEALLRLLGNTRSFRPVLAATLREGFRIGMLAVEGDHLRFASWKRYQPNAPADPSSAPTPGDSTATETDSNDQQSSGGASAEQAQSSDRASAEQKQSNDRAFAPNSAESLNSEKRIREEKKREEKREIRPAERALSLLVPEPEPKGDPVERIFDHWRSAMGHPKARLDDARRRRIRAAMKFGYSEADCIAAIDGCRSSAWHMGANDRGTRYDALDLILRNADQIDKFIAMAPARASAAGGREQAGGPLSFAEKSRHAAYRSACAKVGCEKPDEAQWIALGKPGPEALQHFAEGA